MTSIVTADTLKSWMTSQENIVLIDVREEEEYQAASIPHATLIPLATLRGAMLPEGAATKKIVLYCRSGYRSRLGCEKLLHENPQLDVYNLEGGILQWHQTNLGGKQP